MLAGRKAACFVIRPRTRSRHSRNEPGFRSLRINAMTSPSSSANWLWIASRGVRSSQAISITGTPPPRRARASRVQGATARRARRRPVSGSFEGRARAVRQELAPGRASPSIGCVMSLADSMIELHFALPFHRWPHQQRPSGSTMQTPLPQQRGSFTMLQPDLWTSSLPFVETRCCSHSKPCGRHRAARIDREDVVEVFIGQRGARFEDGLAGSVDHDVDLAPQPDRLVERLDDVAELDTSPWMAWA